MAQRTLGFVLLVSLAWGCKVPSSPPEPDIRPNFIVSSATFEEGGAIPKRCSADGGNISPGLSWAHLPTGTRTLVLIMEDPDAGGTGAFVHWLLYNIPVDGSFAEDSLPPGAKSGTNDAGITSYFGPKPPTGTHHYTIKLYALDKSLDLHPGATKAAVVLAMGGHVVGLGTITGTYEQP